MGIIALVACCICACVAVAIYYATAGDATTPSPSPAGSPSSTGTPAAAGTPAAVPTGMITGKTVQVVRADNKAEYINILGIDIFDQSGARITTGITPTITPAIYANDPRQFGPQHLIDGIHTESNTAGLRLPHSTNVANAAMTLDMGSDKVISKIVVYNRTACCSDRINGCNLVVKKADGTAVLTIPLTGSKAIYTFSAPLTNTSTSSTYTAEPTCGSIEGYSMY
jgi:hypothetical protein